MIFFNRLRLSTQTAILYPFFFTLYTLLAFYGNNIDRTSWTVPTLISFFILLASITLFFIFKLIIKDSHKSALLVFIFSISFFSYGHLHSTLSEIYKQKYIYKKSLRLLKTATIDLRFHLLLVICFFIFLLISSVIIKRKTINKEISFALNKITALLLAFSLANILYAQFSLIEHRKKNILKNSMLSTNTNQLLKRDIYYIILDGYARADVLKKYYNFNNDNFINFLTEKKFYVVAEGHANYAWTFLSLPSSLNFTLLNDLADTLGVNATDISIPFEMIRQNNIVKFLKSLGYTYVHMNSTWGATSSNGQADLQIKSDNNFFQNEFLRVYAETTALKLLSSLITKNLAAIHLSNFEKLKTIPEIKGPKFTFAHILMPHHPYLFDRDGNVVQEKSLFNQFKNTNWHETKAYLEQLMFVNKKIQELIELILKKSEIAPIIIVQSDHGPQIKADGKFSKNDLVMARMANLNALYLPDGGDKMLYPTLTPVNSFRIILNYFFGEKLTLLPDKSYFSSDKAPYDFYEFTTLRQDKLIKF